MKQLWIVSVRYCAPPRPGQQAAVERFAVVGEGRSSTVEAVLHLAKVAEEHRVEIRGDGTVRDFVEGKLDPARTGYYVEPPARDYESSPWLVCIGPVDEVLPP